MKRKIIKPCVVGLGYVGLPLFLKLQKKITTIGYDNNKLRIIKLNAKKDINKEFKKNDLRLKRKSFFTYDKNLLKYCNFFIIAVPTPVLKNNKPDLSFLEKSCKTIGTFLKKGDIVFLSPQYFLVSLKIIVGKFYKK